MSKKKHSHDVTGLPGVLPPDTLGLLYRGDIRLALAHGSELSVYALSHGGEGGHARKLHTVEIQGAVTALGESDSELLVVARCADHSTLGLFRDEAMLTLLRVEGEVTAFASAGGYSYAVVSERSRRARWYESACGSGTLPHSASLRTGR
jgi:hypothetical protein